MDPHQPDVFNPWVDKLGEDGERAHRAASRICSTRCASAIRRFTHLGGRLSDHGLDQCYAADCTDAQAKAIFAKARGGHAATPRNAKRSRRT